MSKIEYRVRAVTRYVVTRFDGASTTEMGEYASTDLASRIGGALALREQKCCPGADASFEPYEGPPPGRTMRCKVQLSDRRQSVNLAHGSQAQGRKEVRDGPHGDYTWVDPTDPANYVMDGEGFTFHAVWGGQDPADGKNACRENRIFADATPQFHLSCLVRNPAALAALGKSGDEYYVDFIPAPKPEASA